jgi:hypothetical protein
MILPRGIDALEQFSHYLAPMFVQSQKCSDALQYGCPDEYVTLDDLLGKVHVYALSVFDCLMARMRNGLLHRWRSTPNGAQT